MALEEESVFPQPQIPATVTIGICAYNEQRNIGPLLRSLLLQKIVGPLEILVVSDGSTDLTNSIVEQIAGQSESIRLVRHSFREGRSAAIDTLFRESTGDIIVIVSADTQLFEGSIQKIIDAFDEPRVGICWSKLVPLNENDGFVNRVGHLAFRLHHRLSARLDLEGDMRHATGDVVAIRREAFTKRPAGCVNDDEFLAINASRMGFEVRYIPLSLYRASMPTTVTDYVNQRRRWVYGHLQVGEMLGEYPTVLECVVTKRPLDVLSIVVHELATHPCEFTILFSSMLLELVVAALVLRDRFLHTSHQPWRVIESTKKPMLQTGLPSLH